MASTEDHISLVIYEETKEAMHSAEHGESGINTTLGIDPPVRPPFQESIQVSEVRNKARLQTQTHRKVLVKGDY